MWTEHGELCFDLACALGEVLGSERCLALRICGSEGDARGWRCWARFFGCERVVGDGRCGVDECTSV